MEKTDKRVSKRIIIASLLATLFITNNASGSIYENKIVNNDPIKYNVMMVDLSEKIEMIRKEVEQKSKAEKKVQIAEVKEEEQPTYSEEDVYWLSRIVSAEAKGETEKGKIAVANVVLNRVKHEEFPDSIKEVVFQKGQFSPVKSKKIYDKPTEEAVEAAVKALEGDRVLEEDVIFFYNPKIAPRSWLRTREEAVTIGEHRFTY